jgi:type III secretory pathway component EscS
MTDGDLLRVFQQALLAAAVLITPVALAAAAVGGVVGFVAGMFRVDEPALGVAVRLAAVGAVLAGLGGWMIGLLVRFTSAVFVLLPEAGA